MQVAELVPEVAALDRSPVRAVEELGAGGGLEQLQVGRLSLVPTGEEAVDGAEPAFGSDDKARPAMTFPDGAVGPGHRLERPDDSRADRDHPCSPAADGVD